MKDKEKIPSGTFLESSSIGNIMVTEKERCSGSYRQDIKSFSPKMKKVKIEVNKISYFGSLSLEEILSFYYQSNERNTGWH